MQPNIVLLNDDHQKIQGKQFRERIQDGKAREECATLTRLNECIGMKKMRPSSFDLRIRRTPATKKRDLLSDAMMSSHSHLSSLLYDV